MPEKDAEIAAPPAAAEPTPTPAGPPPRTFKLFYKQGRAATLEREVVGSVEDALKIACQMLADGSARFVNLVEVGRVDVVIPHSRIVNWCTDQRRRKDEPMPASNE